MTTPRAPTPLIAEPLLFPAAALWGALAVPWSLHSLAGGRLALPGLATPAGHAHELLFGYALAVVAGFLLNRVTRLRLIVLFALWLGGRIGHALAPGGVAALACNVGFAVMLATLAAPPYLRGAKKWRNRIIGPLIIAFVPAVAALGLALSLQAGWSWAVLSQAVLLFALLMAFFGGRTLAPAVAGAIERRGGTLEARVQPGIEGALIVLIVAALLLSPMPATRGIAGAALLVAGALLLLRLARWQLWRCSDRIDLLCLAVGYGWLGVGLLLIGAGQLLPLAIAPAAATHAVTVGALGTLSANMMLRTRLLHLRREASEGVAVAIVLTLLMSAAATLRVFGDGSHALTAAAGCWSGALLLLAGWLLRHRRRGDRR